MRTLVLLFVCFTANGAITWPTGSIPSTTNTLPWYNIVGVPGGIPNRTTIFQTISAGASQSTIQTAINNCPSNQVVKLSAGSYTITSALQLGNNGVTLRGAGTGSTTLNTSSGGYVLIGNSDWYTDWNTPVSGRHVNWTNGLQQGSTQIVVSGVGDLTAGQLIFMDQLNDTNTSAFGADSGSPVGMGYTSVAHPNTGEDRYQFQLNRVTAINGRTLTLSEPVYMANFTTNLTAQIWWFGVVPVQMSGVEDLTIDASGADMQGVYMQDTYACWAKNIVVKDCRYSMNTMVALRCEFRHCYMPGPQTTTDDYCFQIQKGDGLLVEDNIENNAGTAIIIDGGHGSVYAFNYFTNITGAAPWMQGGLNTHGGSPNMNLFEGNVAPGMWWQNNFGSSTYNTAFRNRLIGKDNGTVYHAGGLTGDIQAVDVGFSNRFENVVGNVLGTTGYNTWYDDGAASYVCHDTGRVFSVGLWSGGCETIYDPTARNTLFRILNWDSANGSIVDSNSYAASDLPASLYLSSKPSNFGFLTWPAVEPTASSYSSSITNIPAGYRFIYGVDPPAAPDVAAVSATLGTGTLRVTNGKLTFSQ